MLGVRVAGKWLRTIGAASDVSFSHVWPHGSDSLSWSMRAGTTHPALAGGALVEVFAGGIRLWRGNLSEPGASGEFAAKGSWEQATGVLALSGAAASNVPDTAIDDAIARGAVNWTRPASLSAVSWGVAGELDLAALLDGAMEGLGLRWYVDPDGAVRASADPTVPAFHVPHAAAGLGPTLVDDNYFSHLYGYYEASAGVGAVTAAVGSAIAATRWGRKEAFVDLSAMGVISGATATAEVTARFNLVGARLGFAESLTLGVGELTNPGGVPVSLTMPRAGQMMRLVGVADRRFPTGDKPVTDVVIGRSSYKEGDSTVQLTPMGAAPRNLSDVLKYVVREAVGS